MNGKKAKLLRKIARSVEHRETTYVYKEHAPVAGQVGINEDGTPKMGMIKRQPTRMLGDCARGVYQELKRHGTV